MTPANDDSAIFAEAEARRRREQALQRAVELEGRGPWNGSELVERVLIHARRFEHYLLTGRTDGGQTSFAEAWNAASDLPSHPRPLGSDPAGDPQASPLSAQPAPAASGPVEASDQSASVEPPGA